MLDNTSPLVLYRETERDGVAREWSIGSNEIEINSTSRCAGPRRDVQR